MLGLLKGARQDLPQVVLLGLQLEALLVQPKVAPPEVPQVQLREVRLALRKEVLLDLLLDQLRVVPRVPRREVLQVQQPAVRLALPKEVRLAQQKAVQLDLRREAKPVLRRVAP